MKGFLNHLLVTLRLTFRNKQALVFSYFFPLVILFLVYSITRGDRTAISTALAQLLALTALGASLFGMPVTLVTERERGIWRRYRLLPTAPSWFVASTIVSRFLMVVSSIIIQIVLAVMLFHMPRPNHPIELLVAFTFTCFAFMGLGLIVATIANSTASVQALAQAIFLPLVFLGGVGIPVGWLPPWAQNVAAYLPGRYAVDAMKSCVTGAGGLETALFNLVALTLIGGAACLVAAKMFRWETNQPLTRSAKWWLLAALVPWAAVGLAAQLLGLVQITP